MLSFSAVSLFGLARDVVFAVLVVLAVRVAVIEGWAGLLRRLLELFRLVPGAEALIRALLRRQVRGFLRQLDHASLEEEEGRGGRGVCVELPKKGECEWGVADRVCSIWASLSDCW